MSYLIQPAEKRHANGWLQLRKALWPDADANELAQEVANTLRIDQFESLVLVATVDDNIVGFAEAALRHDYVNGCETSPVGFLEGIYVASDYRTLGIARALVENVQRWAKKMNCKEFASDALLENTDSHAMHKALGFEETERVVYFRKPI